MRAMIAAHTALERRYDIDWLRILAVLLLIPYHTAVIFNRGYVSYIKAEPNAAMEAFAYFLNQWHMALLFLVSGAAAWFSLQSRGGFQFFRERINRLIIPLIFGTFAVVPVQVYFQRLYYHEFSGSYIQFYPHSFDGIYPHGNFTWGQLWFLAYLFVFSVLTLPLFLYLRTNKGQMDISKIAVFCEKPGVVFLAAIPLMLAQALFRAKWPGFQNLYNDWANFALYITVFCYGYILCADPRFFESVERRRSISIVLAIVSMALILALRQTGLPPPPDYSLNWILYMLLHGFSSWCWLMTLLGFGRRYLKFTNRILDYATEAVLPFYILHHAVIVAISYYVVRWQTTIVVKFLCISVLSLALATLIYDLLIRRVYVTRFLFGMKAKPRRKPL
ncbi:MAG: acyltransferase [Candidatus Abyssobacteria bacterium SURF_17]|uniref:Acyltransferase n=1 Tax=Candidatus Abyssobacteria bacterium SURF_17 TaxID=2093361 RepID=A0A419F6L5_9BACT|nr:MAG: acyltransferase [Candidatus Abyssubacteria bacterium SURF_17]